MQLVDKIEQNLISGGFNCHRLGDYRVPDSLSSWGFGFKEWVVIDVTSDTEWKVLDKALEIVRSIAKQKYGRHVKSEWDDSSKTCSLTVYNGRKTSFSNYLI